ncbi:hypothetical protein MOB49_17530 [Bacillus haynesii]|uniref:hypothetical protein n=1 Tax=Bacillus haynesii TaxID=1925021 RepID=UPI00227FB6D2|nr:hypothetical protein [Bacillus haynesii]MCY7845708.1 hypothetical protein [Bacillus haynesii]MCY7968864.1 hypothetical protein [Bacillus haynesii]MCY8019317.1 hypothetical protein [Bacillus haynesii]MCY8392268.1 hypothetical protein [Bacillus haynesii]MCY8584758.1 hypothetical protein [Bacillus haynesii]
MSRDKYSDIIPMANLNFDDLHRNIIDRTSEHLENLDEEIVQEREHREAEEKEYREQSLKLLAGIEKNTAVLHEITFLLRTSNDKQEETFKLIVEMLEILKSNNKDEAISRYRKVMDKINRFSGDTQTIQSLYSLGGSILNVVNSLNF